MNKVIVVGGLHPNTYGLVRSLGEAGLKSHVILEPCQPKINWLFASKYIVGKHILSVGGGLVDYLLSTFGNEKEKPVIYCGSDSSISELDEVYDQLKDKFFIFNVGGTKGQISHFLNKYFMFPLAEKCGLRTIKTWHLRKEEIATADLTYPILIKPNNSLGGQKSDIKISYNKEELLANIHDGIDYILQEYIEKDYELMYLGVSLNHGNKALTPGILRKYRQYPYGIGGTSFASIDSIDKYPEFKESDAIDFIRKLGYEGLFSIEFVVKNGICYFLEINMRNDGLSYFSTGAGLNLPLAWYRYCCGISDNSQSLHLSKPFYFFSELHDIKHIGEGHLSWKDWLKSLLKTDAFFIINRKDFKPGMEVMTLSVCQKLKKVVKRE